jgi:lactose/L-arabinose transport system permease protein
MQLAKRKLGEPKPAEKTIVYIIILFALFVSLAPFYIMFVSSTNSNVDILSLPPKMSVGNHLMKNWQLLNEKVDILRVFSNSVFVSFIYTTLTIFLSAVSGYAISKYNFKGKNIIFSLILVTIMLPGQVMYVPLFQMMNNLGWANSYQAIILPGLANAFGLFLMRQNMMGFPDSLIESARIDGYGEISIFFKIVLPNMKPALGALGIYIFSSSWNSFMWPLIILSTKNMYTLPVALSVLNGVSWRREYGVILLGATIATLPIIIIFLIFQKQFVSGILGGSIKE